MEIDVLSKPEMTGTMVPDSSCREGERERNNHE